MTPPEARHQRRRGGRDGVVAPEGCDQLAALLDAVADAEAAQARIVAVLARLQCTGEVEERTGVAVEMWLLAAGVTGSDRRMLATAVTQLRRLPAVAQGLLNGTVSWGQTRALCLMAEQLSTADVDQFDARLGPAVQLYHDADPDVLVTLARQIVDHLLAQHVATATERTECEPFVSMQPSLDGSGGRLYGELDGVGFGLVAASLTAGAPLPTGRGRLVGDRDQHQGDGTGSWARQRQLGSHRADRLVQLCADDLARTGRAVDPALPLTADAAATDTSAADAPSTGNDASGIDRTRAISPQVTLLLDAGQLLGDDPLPAELLTTVTGGRLKVSGKTARRWLDEAGARLTTIVLDEVGQTLGIGRTTRHEPGWLTRARLATDATCRAPGCRTAASACDADHHTPWHPTTPHGVGGSTDVDNLGSLCRTDNTAKHRQGWQVVRDRDHGTVRWNHPRTGLQVKTAPWTTLRAAAERPAPSERAGPPPDLAPPDRRDLPDPDDPDDDVPF